MKKITLTLFALLFAMLAAAQTYRSLGDIRLKEENGQWFKIETNGETFKVDEQILTIKLKNKSLLHQVAEKYSLKIIRNSISGFVDVQVPENLQFFDIANKLFVDSEIEVLDINTFGKYNATPNDPHFGSQWYLTRIGMPAVWDVF